MTDTAASKWINPKLGRVPMGEEGNCTCKPVGHPGAYRAEIVDSETGEVHKAHMCTTRAAEWAHKHALAFPPGMWRDGQEEPGKPPQAFRIPPGTRASNCLSCGASVHWIVTDAGRRMPVDPDGQSHFITCPNAAKHRKRRTT